MEERRLSDLALFQGAREEDIPALLRCLEGERRQYAKGEYILRVGERVRRMGLVLRGCVYEENDDAWGSRTLLGLVGPGQVFAETYACLPDEPSRVNAVAAEDTEVLLLNVRRLLAAEGELCRHSGVLVRNLLTMTAGKNLLLSRRVFYTSYKSIRGRVLAYLSDQAVLKGSASFRIPFDRQQLADFLGVDRSALSNELSKLRREGLLAVRKNEFRLLEPQREFSTPHVEKTF